MAQQHADVFAARDAGGSGRFGLLDLVADILGNLNYLTAGLVAYAGPVLQGQGDRVYRQAQLVGNILHGCSFPFHVASPLSCFIDSLYFITFPSIFVADDSIYSTGNSSCFYFKNNSCKEKAGSQSGCRPEKWTKGGQTVSIASKMSCRGMSTRQILSSAAP